MVHFNLMAGRPGQALVGLFLVLSIGLLVSLLYRNRSAAAIIALAMLGCALVLKQVGTLHALYLPPIAFNSGLCALFASTLRRGKMPLITRYIQMMEGEVPAELVQYSRNLTRIWTVFFALMALISALLALYAPVAVWSLFTNFINYLLVLLLLGGEYFMRDKLFPHRQQRGFVNFLRRLIATSFHRPHDQARAVTTATLPLIAAHHAVDPIAWRDGEAISQNAFLAHVDQLAQTLPDHRYAVNLCTDRYHFMVAFAAVIVRGQCNLLPPGPAPRVLADIVSDYPDAYCLTDEATPDLPAAEYRIGPGMLKAASGVMANPAIAADHIAALAFTSGSTGRARANPKTWGSLVTGARLASSRFGIESGRIAAVVATVPPQHMYGLETSVMLPLVSGVAVSAERPFFPADINTALAAVPSPRVLVTTPVHLRTCVRAGLDWPEIAFVISATAPMPADLAEQTEARLKTRLLEIFGATEVGSMASRRTLDGPRWRLYDGMSLREAEGRFFVTGPSLADEVPLSDVLRLHDAMQFELLGRCADMVLIAGKRMSLADLNHKLNDIDGVEDGVFFAPEETHDGTVTRLAAFVVAPGLSREQINDALAERLDPLFLPRPLVCVARLPRNETGKLPRASLLALLSQRGVTA